MLCRACHSCARNSAAAESKRITRKQNVGKLFRLVFMECFLLESTTQPKYSDQCSRQVTNAGKIDKNRANPEIPPRSVMGSTPERTYHIPVAFSRTGCSVHG